MGEQVFSWLKSLPSAPEYYPTIVEFRDPVSYIFKIEQEASRYGICKIVPPFPNSSKKTIMANLNRDLSSQTPDSSPTFTTRKQQIGFSPRKNHRTGQRSVWESGETYTLSQFKQKAKQLEQKRLNLNKDFTPLEIETAYWKAQAGKPFSVEYANDMPGSAFDEAGAGGGHKLDFMTVGDTQWNTRRAARANGSLLKFLKDEIPGVTSPMVYLGMLYSWFAWHVEDHDLHSLNYMHMGAPKTWYGIPMEAAFAFEDVIRSHVYGGEISPTEAIATLAGKTTIVSPEVLVKAGVPCFRLLQNPGEFIVTFPRAYHSGFSHGYNCADAVNMATPGWLRVARDAAIRRAYTDSPPLLCDSQLLCDLALSLFACEQKISKSVAQSSRLRERLNYDGDAIVKRTFTRDVMHNNELLDGLGNGSPITLLSDDVLNLYSSYDQPNKKADPASVFSCVACGSPCYSCAAIVQPSKAAVHYLRLNEDVNVIDPRTSLSGKLPNNSSTTGEQSDTSALQILASAYGDSSDSDVESSHSLGSFDNDSLRVHVFCLEHAREVEKRLRSVGGVHMLLLCHQDYPEINNAARAMWREFGTYNDMWTSIQYRDLTEQDKMMIHWALDDEQTSTGNQDWVVKLGIDIFQTTFRKYSPSNDQQEDYQETLSGLPKMNVKHKQQVVRKSMRKRKRTIKGMFLEGEASPPPLPPVFSSWNSCFKRKRTNINARNVSGSRYRSS